MKAKNVGAFLAVLSISFLLPSSAKVVQSESKSVHRLDFRVEGASCVTCLRRIGQTFRSTSGVFKADVSIYKPYWAIVIYDSSKTNFGKLCDAIKNEHVRLVDVEDKVIPAVPAVILPKSLAH